MIQYANLKKYVKISGSDTTNWTFKLACRLNVMIIFFFVVLLSARQLFGEPVDCTGSYGGVSKASMDNYCWVMGIYVQKGFTGVLTSNTASKGYITGPINGERIYLRYYQWLPLICMVAGMLYSIPFTVWKHAEGGRLDGIASGLKTPLFEDTWTPERRSAVVSYFLDPGTRRVHSWYAIKYFLCQILLLFISIFNIWMIDTVFSGFWVKYFNAIQQLYNFNYDGFVESTALIFPRMAKCEYVKYGPSGSNVIYDSLCLLPLNILNEKIFAFLFIWLLLIFAITAWGVIYSLIVASSGWLRTRILALQAHNVSMQEIKRATNNGACGEFFVLHLVGKNVNHYVFKDLITELSKSKTAIYSKSQTMATKFEEVPV